MPALTVNQDLFPLAAAVLAALTCALLGNFLLLRRQSLMGDAISHAVLPGLVIAFILSSSKSPSLMFLGATGAALCTVGLTEVIRRLGRVEPGAAMGVVFSAFFALGVLMIEQAARNIDLDADCVLYGQLETLAWYGEPVAWSEVLSVETLRAVPRQVATLLAVFVLVCLCTLACFKELRAVCFDAAFASTQGIPPWAVQSGLMGAVAASTVAAFEAVGSILVIAMLICPGATARLLTDRLSHQLVISLVAGAIGAVGGYLAATAIPAWFGSASVVAAGPIGMVSGLLVALAAVGSPRHGIIARWIRRRAVRRQVARDHVLADLYRQTERRQQPRRGGGLAGVDAGAVRSLQARGLVVSHPDSLVLTEAGVRAAEQVIRRHRLWEQFLVSEAGLAPDHVHLMAEQLEHVVLDPGTGMPRASSLDPHGRPIPPTHAPGDSESLGPDR